MKKLYSKPEIMFESFSVSTNIAGGCGIPTHTPSEGNCAYEASGVMIFTDAVSQCAVKAPGDAAYNGLCYHVPIDTGSLFNS